jgi:hypothetical protein
MSAVPTFLRQTIEPWKGEHAATTASKVPPPTLPRPVTPRPSPEPAATPRLDPATLPMPSLSRRRVITAAGVLLAGWLTISFVRQVGEATAAADRAEELRAANAALKSDVERLERDLDHVQDARFIQLQGRAFGLGSRGERAFALAAGAPSLAADAPGSADVRLGAPPRHSSPLDAWLEVLFGAPG